VVPKTPNKSGGTILKQVIKHEARNTDEELAVAYVRASSKKREQEESYHAQWDYWEKKPFISKIYGDNGISGRNQRKRDDFLQLMTDAKLGKFKTIYTKTVTRFGRNNIETVQAIQELRAVGVNVVFEVEGLDTQNLSNELFIRIRTILAEQESESISENVKWSYRKRFKQGIHNTQRMLYGYITHTDKEWEINEAQAKVVRLIYDLYLGGLGHIKILHHLKEKGIPSYMGNDAWSTTSIREILQNEKYTGNLLLQKTFARDGLSIKNKGDEPQYFVENNHPAIIDQATFENAQALRLERQKKSNARFTTPKEYEFTGKIECGLCGKKFKRRTNTKIKNFSQITWICGTSDIYGVSACRANQIGDELIKEIAVDAFNEYLDTPKVNDKITETKDAIAELVGKEKGIRDFMTRGLITYPQFMDEQKIIKAEYERLDQIIQSEQGDGLYQKTGTKQEEFTDEIADHIEKIVMRGYKITFVFRNKQEITRRYKYEHRRYVADND
jgi:DNA invertase Pin-like site-specific DNA recombinase